MTIVKNKKGDITTDFTGVERKIRTYYKINILDKMDSL